MSLSQKSHFILFLVLLAGAPELCRAQISIGKEEDSSWMTRELPSEVMAGKKFTFKRRLLQNLVTRFNAYYNARTRLEEAQRQAMRKHRDDYDSLLTQYPYIPADFSGLQGNLDSVRFDAGYGIQIHDPRSKWIDNLYLITGKAYYFQQDYANAIAAFRFIVRNNGEKTTGNTPEVIGSGAAQKQISIATPEKKKLFYHRPSRNEAFIWLIRSYIDSGAYEVAGSLLNVLQEDPVFPARLSSDLLAMQARFFLSRQQTDKGMEELAKAAAKEKDNILKARWYFILGQYFDGQKNWERATHYYELASRLRPAPLMRFYARLNMIGVYMQQDSANYVPGTNSMLEMARRERYELYRSIIYYHLAQKALQFGHNGEAIAYLKKGLWYNEDNTGQRLKNYYLLAHTLYDAGRYREAGAYYDSTAGFMDASFKHNEEVALRQATLGDLVLQRDIVDRQDSLQRLAAMPPPDLENYLEQIIADSMKARRKRNLFMTQAPGTKNGATSAPDDAAATPGRQRGSGNQAWYFYNPDLKAKGFSLFQSTWGKRALADNWRLGSGASVQPAQPGMAGIPPDSVQPAPGSPGTDTLDQERQKLMAPIPLTPPQMKKSNDSIIEALFNEAAIFADRLNNDTAAIHVLHELLARFPENPYLAAAYYRLHILYARAGDTRNAGRYQLLLSEKFPASKYNAALARSSQPTEPYARKVTTRIYEKAYMDYLNSDYPAVQKLKDSALLIDPNHPQQARFDLLAAMAVIKEQPEGNRGKQLLEQVMSKYKTDTAIVQQARAISDALDRKQGLIDHLTHLQLPENTGEPASEEAIALPPQPDTATHVPVQNPAPPPAPVPPVKDTAVTVSPAPAAPPPTPYKINAKDSYFVVLSFNRTDSKIIEDCLQKFAAYNEKKHTGEGIEVSTYLINQQVLLIFRLFPGEEQALKYYREIGQTASKEIIPALPPNYYTLFVISRENFILLNSTKDLSGYIKFFLQNYR